MKQLQKFLKEFNGQLTPCVVCYLVKENQVLLGKRIKVSNDLGQNLFSGIGGKLEIGETSEDALIREVKEEIDVEITKFKNFGQVKFLFPHKPKWNQVVDVYLVTKWQGTPINTDVIEPVWFEKDKLPSDLMWDDNKYWLPEVLDGKKVNGVFLFDEGNKVLESVIDHTS